MPNSPEPNSKPDPEPDPERGPERGPERNPDQNIGPDSGQKAPPRPDQPAGPSGSPSPSSAEGLGAPPVASGKVREGEINWPKLIERAGPYPIEAFAFVREGLNHTVERAMLQHESAQRAGLANPDTHHVSGQQLSLGLRDFAILQYGMLAPAVLRHWNIVRTEDFGRIVYAMIEGGVMSKTSDDSIEDFASVYDFDEAFSDAHLAARIGG